jgi:hypothetical protein
MMAENADSQLDALSKITVNRVLYQVAGCDSNQVITYMSDKWAPQVKDLLLRIYQDYSESQQNIPKHFNQTR